MSLGRSYFEEFYASKRVDGVVADYLKQEHRVDIVGCNHEAERDNDEAGDVAWQEQSVRSLIWGIFIQSKGKVSGVGVSLMIGSRCAEKAALFFKIPSVSWTLHWT